MWYLQIGGFLFGRWGLTETLLVRRDKTFITPKFLVFVAVGVTAWPLMLLLAMFAAWRGETLMELAEFIALLMDADADTTDDED
jgi:hypothetical protein